MRAAAAQTMSRREAKTQERRDELADAVLATLGELGYARTSLREIAARSDLSHGIVHYYFADKLDLLAYAVRRYKEHCATRYDDAVAAATNADDLRHAFSSALATTMVDDASMHRLWYDMRAQSMFEPTLAEDVRAIDELLEAMIWRVVSRYAELADVTVGPHALLAYSALDGLFENCLVRHHAGDAGAAARLETEAARMLDTITGRTLA